MDTEHDKPAHDKPCARLNPRWAGGIAQAILLLTVRERIQEPSAPRTLASKSDTSGTAAEGGLAERLPVPAIPSARRALSNRPYMRYLAMKVTLTTFSLALSMIRTRSPNPHPKVDPNPSPTPSLTWR